MSNPNINTSNLDARYAQKPRTSNKAVGQNELFVNVKDYGAVGDGVTNDTAAFTSALAVANDVYVPAGSYFVTGITVPAGRRLFGMWSRSYSNNLTVGAIIFSTNTSQTAPVVMLNGSATIDGIGVKGAGSSATPSAIKFSGNFNTVRNCTAVNAQVGIDANYVGGNLIDNCFINNNNYGINQIVDTVVSNSYINANKGEGINFSAGGGDNIIHGCKIEWNNGNGINMYQAAHCTVQNCIIDRNGLAGLTMTQTTDSVIVGNVFRRNGRLASGVYVSDTHIFEQNASRLTITGNTTLSGADDDGSGYTSPSFCVIENGGTDINYVGNYLGGSTAGYRSIAAGGTRITYTANMGVTGVQTTIASRTVIGTGGTGNLAATTGTSSITFTNLDPLNTYFPGNQYRLVFMDRNGSTGARCAAELVIVIGREGGNASISNGTMTNNIGSLFGLGTGLVQITLSCAADGSTLTVNVANTDSSIHNVTIRLV